MWAILNVFAIERSGAVFFMDPTPNQRGIVEILTTVGFHVIVVSVLALGSAACFASPASREALGFVLSQGVMLDTLLVDLALHAGLCAVVWATLFFLGRRLWRLVDRRPAGGEPLRLGGVRGTVITETLIVLPVALLLIMGIAQLALVNIAATLTDLAVIQSARSVWVWAPEAQEGRFFVDRSTVREKARVQAAAVLTPAASSNFGRFGTGQYSGYAKSFRKAMGAIYGAQLDDAGTDIGSYSTSEAELHLSADRQNKAKNFAFNLSFDSHKFEERTARKFFNAWVHTDIEIVESDEFIGARMTYHQPMLMPLVAGIFGDFQHINGEAGYYVSIERAYTLRKQVKPNANLPLP
jgi:hypothetical protein